MLVPAEVTTIDLFKVTASTPPGDIFTRLDEDLRLGGCECKQVCIVRKSLIFLFHSPTIHVASFIYHYTRGFMIQMRISPQPAAPKPQKEWPLARSPITIDSASLGARPISGLVQRACTVYGWVRTYLPIPFLVVWLTFLVNRPYEPPFSVYRWRGTSNTGLMISTSNNGRSNG